MQTSQVQELAFPSFYYHYFVSITLLPLLPLLNYYCITSFYYFYYSFYYYYIIFIYCIKNFICSNSFNLFALSFNLTEKVLFLRCCLFLYLSIMLLSFFIWFFSSTISLYAFDLLLDTFSRPRARLLLLLLQSMMWRLPLQSVFFYHLIYLCISGSSFPFLLSRSLRPTAWLPSVSRRGASVSFFS